MSKAELFIKSVGKRHETLPAQRFESGLEVRVMNQLLQLSQLKSLAADAGCLKDIPFELWQSIETRSQDTSNALRHIDLSDCGCRLPQAVLLDEVAFIDQHLNELFAEEWRSCGALDDLLSKTSGQRFNLQQTSDQGRDFFWIQRIQGDGRS